MWELVLHGSGGNTEIMEDLIILLHRFPDDFNRSWALDALDKALFFQRRDFFGARPKLGPPLSYRPCGGMPSVGGPSAGEMSGSNISGDPTALRRLPWAASASPPLPPSAEAHIQPSISSVTPNLDPAPTTGNEELPPPGQPQVEPIHWRRHRLLELSPSPGPSFLDQSRI